MFSALSINLVTALQTFSKPVRSSSKCSEMGAGAWHSGNSSQLSRQFVELIPRTGADLGFENRGGAGGVIGVLA